MELLYIDQLLNDDIESFASNFIDDFNIRIDLRSGTLKYPKDLCGQPSLISLAAYLGATQCFTYLLSNDADPEQEDDFGRNTIHFACMGGNVDIFQSICPIMRADSYGNYPIHYAVAYNRHKITLEILKIDKKYGLALNHNNEAPIHIAFRTPDVNSINILTSFEIDPLLETKINKNILDYAISSYCIEAVELAIRLYPIITTDAHRLVKSITNAVDIGSLKMVKLLQRYINLSDDQKEHLLIHACEKGYLDIVKFFIRKTTSIKVSSHNGKRVNLCNFVCKNEKIMILKFLFESSLSNINDILDETICQCLIDCDFKIIQYLFSLENERFIQKDDKVIEITSSKDKNTVISEFPKEWIDCNY